MSSSAQPTGPSESPSAKRPNQDTFYWNKLPSIRLLVPPKGAHSYKTDERCFTYCSQSVRGRAQGQEPWCRSICIRKIFPHEVRKVMRVVESTPEGTVLKDVETETKVPLPPEGQRLPSWLTGKRRADDDSREEDLDDLDDLDPAGGKGWKSIVNDVEREGQPMRSGTKVQETDPEVWKAGWYLWLSKNKWAVQEKMDGMMTDLERQAEWTKMKRDVNQEWERAQQMAAAPSSVGGEGHRQHEEKQSQPESLPEADPEPASQGHGNTVPSATSVTFVSEESLPTLPNPPFPDTTSSTLLVPVPPPLPPLGTYMSNLLAPTNKVLKLTHESLTSGNQTKFAGMLWEKAKSDQPYVLARNVTRKIWTIWSGDEEDDGEGRKKER
ncbi:hypothetical protein PsYK624_075990 [Phanerochaete sordida]|uniref:Uncharacterized protein n=1 Tax=Phanerochaete sordida TaxID=48140 RepID=A0A9P3LEB7_9APHY|nr:hypothetical protein PsYK624_075990 [Phanerochaete sordida]